ncbi:hypothetical protein ETD83_32970 [Actinomadura soli]|uniref:Uncharacterized protein n=1 Tax=Actinomadura soli TaxID=2508997 RepID=A0A5C4J2V8_9ACTN|nr:hypothetical protein [Actinomadura soli]TMQ90990.1 hypothetical protein ETD83_32970 [Actinomadura soli]
MTTGTPNSAKADLKRDFPDWNIICSTQGGWWAQLFPVPRDRYPRENMFNAATADGLRAKLAADAS